METSICTILHQAWQYVKTLKPFKWFKWTTECLFLLSSWNKHDSYPKRTQHFINKSSGAFQSFVCHYNTKLTVAQLFKEWSTHEGRRPRFPCLLHLLGLWKGHINSQSARRYWLILSFLLLCLAFNNILHLWWCYCFPVASWRREMNIWTFMRGSSVNWKRQINKSYCIFSLN